MIRTFSEAVEKLKLGTSQNKSKAKDLSCIQEKMFNLKFVLELSGSCDIYIRFGHAVNVLQTVNMLPHVRFDTFVEIVSGLKTMATTILI